MATSPIECFTDVIFGHAVFVNLCFGFYVCVCVCVRVRARVCVLKTGQPKR